MPGVSSISSLENASPFLEQQPISQPVTNKSGNIQIKKSSDSKSEDKNSEAARLEKLQDKLAENNIALKFRRDDKTNELVVELFDDKTGEVIRQIPSEVSLKLSAEFGKLQGQFIDKQG